MVEKRKIKCDCGNFLEVKVIEFDHFNTEAMVCPKCNFVTLTKNQALKFMKIKELHEAFDSERKIIP